MFVKRFFEPAIAQASYLIGCAKTGESIVIDANRDVDQYIEAASREGLRITHVTETHIHADYVSGSRELAQKARAMLLLSDEGDRDWKYQFTQQSDRVRLLHDGDRIDVGNVRLDVLHTPGHTPEHLTFLVTDGAAADKPIAAVTGDFVFVGDVGRPDLLERAAHYTGTMESSARTLWRSLQKFAALDDWLQIWPGHGAGSSCGKGISAIPSSTLGYERRFNWAFAITDEDEFVRRVLEGQPEPPPYFAAMKRINKEGPAILNGWTVPLRHNDQVLTAKLNAGAVVIDTRPAAVYARGHLPGSLNIPFNASFVTWAGWLIPTTAEVYLIVEADMPHVPGEIVRSLALIGVDAVRGVFTQAALVRASLAGQALTITGQITPQQLSNVLHSSELVVVDVRSSKEWASGHLEHAIHIPLGHLSERVNELPRHKLVITQCESGGRSSIAASLLEQHGFSHVLNLTGGLSAWRAAGSPIVGGVDEPQAVES